MNPHLNDVHESSPAKTSRPFDPQIPFVGEWLQQPYKYDAGESLHVVLKLSEYLELMAWIAGLGT